MGLQSFVFLSVYNVRRLLYNSGVKEIWQHIASALAGLFFLVLGVRSLIQDVNATAVIMLVLGAVAVLGGCWMCWRSIGLAREARRALERLGTPAKLPLMLPYGELVARFLALGKVDSTAAVYEDCLSWSLQSTGRILIRKEGDSEWTGLFWQDEAQPHGVLVYKRGELCVYPANARELCFLGNIFLPARDEFNAWLRENYKDAG